MIPGSLNAIIAAAFSGGGGTVLTPLLGTAFTYDQLSTAVTGQINSTTNGTYHLAEIKPSTFPPQFGTTSICLIIKGTSATLNATPLYGGASQVFVQVDGGARTTATNVSTTYTLFTGLSDTEHTVVISFGNGTNDSMGLLKSGTVLNITGGTGTYVILPTRRLSETLGDTDYAYRQFTVAGNANMVPTTLAQHNQGAPYSGTGGGSNGSIVVRSNARKVAIVSRAQLFYYSIDGGPRIRVDSGFTADQQFPRAVWIDLDGLSHTYTFTAAQYSNHFWVQLYGGTVTPITRNRLDQFGDSITGGLGFAPADLSTYADPEVLWVANKLGFVGRQFGNAGEAGSALNTRLDTLLPLITVSSNDVAIVATGRNSATQADYQNIINKLIAKGYGKVIVRSILPIGVASNFSTVQAAVAAVGNPNVIALDTSTWTGISNNDGIHPNFAGYLQLYNFAGPAYASALGVSW